MYIQEGPVWLQGHLRNRRSSHKNPFDTPLYCLVEDIRLNLVITLLLCGSGCTSSCRGPSLFSFDRGISGQEAEQPHVLSIHVPL